MGMPQRRVYENQYFVARETVERDDAITGAVSDLIRVVSESSFRGVAVDRRDAGWTATR